VLLALWVAVVLLRGSVCTG